MVASLEGKLVGVLVADGFEQVEFDEPVRALREAGATVDVLVEDERHLERVQGMDHLDKAEGAKGDRVLDEVEPSTYDALLIPGGAISPDTMRQSERHLQFVREFVQSGKPTFAICHGPWLLADAGVARGRTLTGWPGIRRDLERAGAAWQDEEVVVDDNLVTSRKPDDIPAFNRAIIDMLRKGGLRHAPRETPSR